MPETGENVAEQFSVGRADQDEFALRSQAKAAAAQENGRSTKEITPVTIPQRKGDPVVVGKDEHPRATSTEALAKLPTPFREGGTVTAGNASGVNDGAAALIVASEAAARKHGLTPIARILGGVVYTYLNNIGSSAAEPIGAVARFAVLAFVLFMAAEQLAIQSQVLVSAFQIAFAALCFALALAFGLGGREWAASVMNRYIRR